MSVHNWDGNHSFRDFARGFQTKNFVKGLNGGVRGVDFQDENAEFQDKLAAQISNGGVPSSNAQAQTMAESAASRNAADMFNANENLDLRLIVPDVQAQQATEDTRRRQLEAERIKKKILAKWKDEDEERDESEEEEEQIEQEAGADDAPDSPFATSHVDRSLLKAGADVIETLMADPEVEMRIYGTMRLQNPLEMQSALNTPLRIARHLNVLARRLTQSEGNDRAAVVAYVASCIHALGPSFGARVLGSFCSGVGIGEVYPLEVLDELLALDPHFVPNLTRRPFLRETSIETWAGGEARVNAPPDMKLTGFALKGGGSVGYEFYAAAEPGEFHLVVDTPGSYRLLLRGVYPDKSEALQELRVRVRPDRRKEPREATVAPVPSKTDAEMEAVSITSTLGRRTKSRPIPTHLAGLVKTDKFD